MAARLILLALQMKREMCLDDAHPERAVEMILGSTDGLGIFQSVIASREEVTHA